MTALEPFRLGFSMFGQFSILAQGCNECDILSHFKAVASSFSRSSITLSTNSWSFSTFRNSSRSERYGGVHLLNYWKNGNTALCALNFCALSNESANHAFSSLSIVWRSTPKPTVAIETNVHLKKELLHVNLFPFQKLQTFANLSAFCAKVSYIVPTKTLRLNMRDAVLR